MRATVEAAYRSARARARDGNGGNVERRERRRQRRRVGRTVPGTGVIRRQSCIISSGRAERERPSESAERVDNIISSAHQKPGGEAGSVELRVRGRCVAAARGVQPEPVCERVQRHGVRCGGRWAYAYFGDGGVAQVDR